MKFSIFVLSILVVTSCSLYSTEQSVTFKIKPSDVGYDVYGEGDELLLEFTEINCDKNELEFLEKICFFFGGDNYLKLKPTGRGYRLRGEDGELLYEFKEGIHSEKGLELLKYIYDVSLEHRQELDNELKK